MIDVPVETNARKWTSLIWKLFTLTALAIMACGAMGVALIANNHAGHVGTCVNDVLGSRNGVTSTDAQAHIDNAQAFRKLLHEFAAVGATSEQKLAAYNRFVAAQDHYVHTLVLDQRYRDKHPLGAC